MLLVTITVLNIAVLLISDSKRREVHWFVSRLYNCARAQRERLTVSRQRWHVAEMLTVMRWQASTRSGHDVRLRQDDSHSPAGLGLRAISCNTASKR